MPRNRRVSFPESTLTSDTSDDFSPPPTCEYEGDELAPLPPSRRASNVRAEVRRVSDLVSAQESQRPLELERSVAVPAPVPRAPSVLPALGRRHSVEPPLTTHQMGYARLFPIPGLLAERQATEHQAADLSRQLKERRLLNI